MRGRGRGSVGEESGRSRLAEAMARACGASSRLTQSGGEGVWQRLGPCQHTDSSIPQTPDEQGPSHEELGTVCVGTLVGHGEKKALVVLQLKRLVWTKEIKQETKNSMSTVAMATAVQ